MALSSTPPATYIYIIGHKRAHYLLLLPYITFPCAPNGGYPKVRSPQSSKIKQCKNSCTAVSTKLLFNFILYLSLFVFSLVSLLFGLYPDPVPIVFFVFCCCFLFCSEYVCYTQVTQSWAQPSRLLQLENCFVMYLYSYKKIVNMLCNYFNK